MKKILQKYSHAWLLVYFPIYMFFFGKLEKMNTGTVHIISCPLDQYIPFLEIFVVPYLMWFLYLFIYFAYLALFDKEAFTKTMLVGMIGMTTFLIVSWLYPNGLELRPEYFVRDNIFTQITAIVYRVDSPMNVLPSIHVFNTMAMFFGIRNSKAMERRPMLRIIGYVMTILIILSTMFLKQHSVVDVVCGLALSVLSYLFVYHFAYAHLKNFDSSRFSELFTKGRVHSHMLER